MAAPLVSICIPVHNRAAYLAACLDSVAADGYPEKEIVVLDDGSTDDSASVIRRWMDAHPGARVRFETQERRGIPGSCNRLAAMAAGAFVAWLGSDDVLVGGGIAARVDYLASHPEKLAVFGDARVIGPAGEALFASVYDGYRGVPRIRFATDAGLRRALIARWCVPQPVLMVRRGIYREIGPYDESFVVEDYDFYLRMLSRNALGFVDTVVSAYRVHPGNFCWHPGTRTTMMRQFFRAARKNRNGFRAGEQAALLAFGAGAALKAVALDALRAVSPGRTA